MTPFTETIDEPAFASDSVLTKKSGAKLRNLQTDTHLVIYKFDESTQGQYLSVANEICTVTNKSE